MIDGFWLGLLVKLAMTALVVVSATLAAERFGSFVGAMIAALPISAGPAYFFLALDHDAAFLAQSALASLGVTALVPPFLLVYAVMARRFGLTLSLATGLGIWCAGAYYLTRMELTLTLALALNAVSFAICLPAARPFLKAALPAIGQRKAMDVVLRVVAVGGVVAFVVLAGRLLGPTVTGIGAVAPVVWTSMAVILHRRLGGAASSAVLANGIGGMFGFCFALSIIHLLAEPLGAFSALGIALAASVAWSLGLSLARPYLGYYDTRERPAR